MKQSLQVNIGQHLTLTPQLQQAIRLLQLSTIDLTQEIHELVEANPMLELEANTDKQQESNNSDDNQPNSNTSSDVAINDSNIPQELPVDTAWDDIYPSSGTKQISNEDYPSFDKTYSSAPSLHDQLTWQMELSPFSETDRLIAIAIIDAIDSKGFLTLSLEDIQQSVVGEIDDDSTETIELDEIEAVLQRIQRFEPVGVGARTLKECLLIQLQQLPAKTPFLLEATTIVTNYLTELGAHNYRHIMQKMRIKQPELQKVISLIKTINPQPGSTVQESKTEYIIPDVVVKKNNNRWLVELNPEAVPHVRINSTYANLDKKSSTSEDKKFVKNKMQEAKWFLKSLKSRHETLLKVATSIVERQQEFLEHGEEAMKPMVLQDIAEHLEMHESTISRVTTQKYMHTPRGVFELKYFFSSHVNTQSGGECSSTAIRAVLKKLIAAENQQKPLSDNKMATMLKEQGINVARRTIAKYRESLGIPSSSERKSLPQE